MSPRCEWLAAFRSEDGVLALAPEQRGHVGGGQRDLACMYTGCVEERGSDGWWTNRVRGLEPAAEAFVVARDLYDFDLGISSIVRIL